MKQTRTLLTLAVLLLLAVMGAGGAGAQTSAAGSYTLTQSSAQNWDGVTPPALPSGWTAFANTGTSYWKTAASNSRSSPNALVFGTAGVITMASNTTAEASPNCYAQAYGGATTASASSEYSNVFVRGSGTTYATFNGYVGRLNFNSGSPSISKYVNGTETVLASGTAGTVSVNAFYRVRLIAYGTSLLLQIQRDSDGLYLNSSGTFVADASASTFCVTTTDSTFTAAGYAGVETYFVPSSGSVYSDDFSRGTVTIPTLSVSSIQQSPSAQSITFTGSNTSWTGSTTFSASSGTLSNIVVVSATQATASYLPAKGWGQTVTFADNSTTPATIGSVVVLPRTAKAFFVDNAGSDAASGLSGSAWQSLTQAGSGPAEGYAPGDSVTFTGGQTFTGGLALSNVSGSLGNPVVFSSSSSGSPVTISQTAAAGDGIDVTDSQYITLHYFSVTGPGVSSAGTATSTGIGVHVTSDQTGTGKTYFPGVWLDNLTVSQFYNGVLFDTTAGIGPAAATSSTTGVSKGFSGLRFTSSIVHDCALRGVRSQGVNAGTSGGGSFPGELWDRLTVYNVYGLGGAGFSGQSGSGMTMSGASYGTIQNCLVHDCAQHGTTSGGGPVGIWITYCDNSVMQDCEVYNNGIGSGLTVDGGGFDIDGGCVSCVGQRLFSHENIGSGYQIGTYSGTASTGNTFRYCISQNDAQADGGSLHDFGAAGASSFQFCSVYLDGAQKVGSHVMTAWHDEGETSPYTIIGNTIFYLKNGAVLNDAATSALFLGNDYFNPAASPFAYNGTVYASLAAFRTATGQETLSGNLYGLNADPAWTGSVPAAAQGANIAGMTAYNIQPTSPVYGAGVNPFAVLGLMAIGGSDLHNAQARRTNGYDIGAVEYPAAGYPLTNSITSGQIKRGR